MTHTKESIALRLFGKRQQWLLRLNPWREVIIYIYILNLLDFLRKTTCSKLQTMSPKWLRILGIPKPKPKTTNTNSEGGLWLVLFSLSFLFPSSNDTRHVFFVFALVYAALNHNTPTTAQGVCFFVKSKRKQTKCVLVFGHWWLHRHIWPKQKHKQHRFLFLDEGHQKKAKKAMKTNKANCSGRNHQLSSESCLFCVGLWFWQSRRRTPLDKG